MSVTTRIIELQAGGDSRHLDHGDVVLVKGDTDVAQTCERLRDATPSRIAFVTPNVKRSRRRLAVSLGLSDCFGCPCRVFHDEDTARRWLTS